MITKLSFTFSDKAKWSKGSFEIVNLCINGAGEEITVDYDEIHLFLDNQLYEGGITTWNTNNLSTEELFDSVLSSFLRENKDEYKSFDESWSAEFKELLDLKEWKDGFLTKLPFYSYKVKLYTLELATDDFRFYVSDDCCLMLNTSGGIITDYENFYFQGLGEELADIFLEKKTCLYMSDETKAMVEEYGGKSWWIQEYSQDEEPDI